MTLALTMTVCIYSYHLQLSTVCCRFDVRPDNRTFNTDWGSIKTGMRWVPLHACDFENRWVNRS